jgi:hypothetical protein
MVASRAKINRPRPPRAGVRSIERTLARKASISAREVRAAGAPPWPAGAGARSSGDFAIWRTSIVNRFTDWTNVTINTMPPRDPNDDDDDDDDDEDAESDDDVEPAGVREPDE